MLKAAGTPSYDLEMVECLGQAHLAGHTSAPEKLTAGPIDPTSNFQSPLCGSAEFSAVSTISVQSGGPSKIHRTSN